MLKSHDDGNNINTTRQGQQSSRTRSESKQSSQKNAHASFSSNLRASFDSFLVWCNSNVVLLKGLGALTLGLFMIFSAFRMIIGILFFLSGIALVYYGLRLLQLNQITDAIENMFAKLFNRS